MEKSDPDIGHQPHDATPNFTPTPAMSLMMTYLDKPNQAEQGEGESGDSDVLVPLGVVDDDSSQGGSEQTKEDHQSTPQARLTLQVHKKNAF